VCVRESESESWLLTVDFPPFFPGMRMT
jgi:hypothetical protein